MNGNFGSFKIIKTKEEKKHNRTFKYFEILKGNNKDFNINEIFKINEMIGKKIDKKERYAIRAMNIHKFFTLKSFDRSLYIESYFDYYYGTILDSSKFEKIKKIFVIIEHYN